jgi:putative ABC transport system permease protein
MYSNYIFVRINARNIHRTLESLEKKWNKLVPGYPFVFHFSDAAIDNLYRSERRLGKILRYFTFIALLISCLGLFGLVSFMAENRTREIGIRKVLGAPILGIVVLFSKEFTKWVLLANLIAWPIAYYIMKKWLQHFAYHTTIRIDMFIISGLLTFLLALLTVSYQSIKAARANPVDALKYE